MTYEKALEMFECGKRDTECEVKKELYEIASKAIKKQIPIKVTEYKGAFVDGYKAAKCRICKHGVLSFDVFCSHCGQALDWGAEE